MLLNKPRPKLCVQDAKVVMKFIAKHHADQDNAVQLPITENFRVPPISGAQRLLELNSLHCKAQASKFLIFCDVRFHTLWMQLDCLEKSWNRPWNRFRIFYINPTKETKFHESPKPHCSQPQVGQLGTSTEPSSWGYSTWAGKAGAETRFKLFGQTCTRLAQDLDTQKEEANCD